MNTKHFLMYFPCWRGAISEIQQTPCSRTKISNTANFMAVQRNIKGLKSWRSLSLSLSLSLPINLLNSSLSTSMMFFFLASGHLPGGSLLFCLLCHERLPVLTSISFKKNTARNTGTVGAAQGTAFLLFFFLHFFYLPFFDLLCPLKYLTVYATDCKETVTF